VRRLPYAHAMKRAVVLACLGLTGSLLVALSGPQLFSGGDALTWWFSPRLSSGHFVFYAGMVLLAGAWLALGASAREGVLAPRALWLIGGLWALPLLAGPPLFSHDVYSYLAQGTITHLGRNPYRDPPTILAHLGHAHVLDTVSPFWRKTTAPYGPLFLGLVSGIVSLTGSHVIAGVLAVKGLEVIGFVLVAVFVPRLARRLGADPSRAVWLALLSPLVLLELIAAGHNDLLMVGLMVAGVTFAVEGRPLLGIGLCVVAATIKVPAAVAALFIAVVWLRTIDTPRGLVRAALQMLGLTVALLAAVSVVTGLGLGWISGSVFSTPERVQLSITPFTALGWTVAHLLGDVGVSLSSRHLESTLIEIAFVCTLVLGAWLLYRARFANFVRYLGILFVVFAFCGPAAWPWYFAWGITLLAACQRIQFSRAAAVAIAAAAFVVKPDGIVALPLKTSPLTLALYVLIGAALVWAWRRRRGGVVRLPSARAPLAEQRVLG
jgi:alpha-1,6-mannosyltransferase